MVSLIVATDNCFGIAKNSTIPWYLPEDLKMFKRLTSTLYEKNAVVMGWKTWESLPKKPLQGRKNIIITKKHCNVQNTEDVQFFDSPESFLRAGLDKKIHYWIIGGQMIYDWFLDHGLVHDIYHTLLKDNYFCDKFINLKTFISDNSTEIIEISKNNDFQILQYKIPNKEEQQILDILVDILDNGNQRMERTGTGTISSFGYRAIFNLEHNTLPLMTTRSHSLRWIFEELMWILRGQTDVKILENKGINIWTPNSTQQFLDKLSLNISLKEGDIGASYGFQMRHFGEQYTDCNGTYKNGVDQLSEVIRILKTDPTSRRIIISLWNPTDLKKAALPPCLLWYQFYVRHGHLDCQFMNRSSDTSVAGGWNVTTASLLTIFLANVVGLKPGRVIWIVGDAHIYMNNIDATRELVQRTPRPFPKLYLKSKIESLEELLNLKYEDLILVNYKSENTMLRFCMNA